MVKAFELTADTSFDQHVDEDEDRLEHVDVDWDEVQNETPIPIPFRKSCVAHYLQLVVGDGLKEAMRSIQLLLQKCSSIVASIHKSCKATELLESEAGYGIPSPNVTSWNSRFRIISAINRLNAEHATLMARLCEVMGSRLKFTETDKATLNELQVLLKPFQVLTEKLSSETKITSSQVLPNIIGLKRKLQQTATHFCTSVKTGLLVSMDKRFQSYETDRHYIISAALDPQIQLRWTKSAEEECRARAILLEMCEAVPVQHTADPSGGEAVNADDDNDLLCFMQKKPTSQIDSTSEVDRYLSVITDEQVENFWQDPKNGKRFPQLKVLHAKHHCIPATSAAMERVFSAARYIVNTRRSRLADSLVEQMVLSKCNADLLP